MTSFASTTSVALVGVEPRPVRVEVSIAGGGKGFSIVGLPDAAVREAKDRVRAAIAHAGFTLPSQETTVNLSPANLPKGGSVYDLPIALAVLRAAGKITERATDVVAMGELALDASLRPVVGALGAAVLARSMDVPCIVPSSNITSCIVDTAHDVRPASGLREAIQVAEGLVSPTFPTPSDIDAPIAVDLSEIRGQRAARRALELAAAGGHNLLLSGPPGAGKTMLARALPSLLPDLEEQATLDVALAWGAAGLDVGTWVRPPFRAPHHSATTAALIGGGSGVPVPGEVTLAHHGVLFLDELGEFPPHNLDALRQPIEDGSVVVARKGSSVCFPSDLQVVAATNPCPCGYREDALVACRCTQRAMDRYRRRFSGPLLDRLDLRVRVVRLGADDLVGPPAESTDAVRVRVAAARSRQRERGHLNARLGRDDLDGLAWTEAAEVLLRHAISSAKLTARGWDRVRRVSVTSADLEGSDIINDTHVAEALALREVA